MMTWAFAIVITASMGSFVQDLFLPMFLRRAEDTPKKAEPQATERSILAMVLDDMESLDLIKAQPRHPRARSLQRQSTVALASTGLARRPAA
jgi:hypothetical protein